MPINDNHEWLTYESLFNKGKFKKPKCKFKFELYLIPFNEVLFWLRDDVSAENVKVFKEAFFPDISVDTIKRLATGFFSWKHTDSDLKTTVSGNSLVCSPRSNASPRNELIIYLTPYVVMPFNRFDNSSTSTAIGTKNHGTLLKVKDRQWDGWKTASRSCVVRFPPGPSKASDRH